MSKQFLLALVSALLCCAPLCFLLVSGDASITGGEESFLLGSRRADSGQGEASQEATRRTEKSLLTLIKARDGRNRTRTNRVTAEEQWRPHYGSARRVSRVSHSREINHGIVKCCSAETAEKWRRTGRAALDSLQCSGKENFSAPCVRARRVFLLTGRAWGVCSAAVVESLREFLIILRRPLEDIPPHE